jgi:hypothetical protein
MQAQSGANDRAEGTADYIKPEFRRRESIQESPSFGAGRAFRRSGILIV